MKVSLKDRYVNAVKEGDVEKVKECLSPGSEIHPGECVVLILNNSQAEQRSSLVKKLIEEKLIDVTLLLEILINGEWDGGGSRYASVNCLQFDQQDALLKIALEEGVDFSNIKIHNYPPRLPSFEIANMMFDKSIDPNVFLTLVSSARCKKCTYENQAEFFEKEFIASQDKLIDEALEKGADVNLLLKNVFGNYRMAGRAGLMKKALDKGAKFSKVSLMNANYLPSLDEAKMMFEDNNNSIDPTKFLSWIVSVDYKAGSDIEQDYLVALQAKLIDLAVAKGADLGGIYFDMLPNHGVAEKLMEMGVAPDYFVGQISKVLAVSKNKNPETRKWDDYYTVENEEIEKRDELVKLAIKKGAKEVEIDDSWMHAVANLMNMIDEKVSDKDKRRDHDYIVRHAGVVTNDEGKTLLMLFAENGCLGGIDHLFYNGVDLSKKDKNGKTAVKLAEDAGYTKIADLLKSGIVKQFENNEL